MKLFYKIFGGGALKESMTDAEKRAWRRMIVHALNQNNTLNCFALSEFFYEVSQIDML
jgi:hypothetical protein